MTKLPFPVHVIEQVTNRDLVSNTKLVTTYRYRHGYYDGVEREFRGFAHVEQSDAESVVGDFDLPPVVTKTWFHNGAFLEEGKLEAYFKDLGQPRILYRRRAGGLLARHRSSPEPQLR